MSNRHWARVMLTAVASYIAVLIALYIAFSFDLGNPWWAMLTVFLTQPPRPLAGAIWAKAFYRAIGTIIGGVACVVFIPNIASSPMLLFFVVAGWLGVCTYLGALERSPRSYVFFLSGYTLAFVGLPGARAPENMFNVAVLRVEEILIGILAFALMQGLLFSERVGPAVLGLLDATMSRTRGWITDVLLTRGRVSPPMNLAARLTEINLLLSDWYFEGSVARMGWRALWALEERLVLLMPAITALQDRMFAASQVGELDGKALALLAQAARWMSGSHRVDETSIQSLREEIRSVMPTLHSGSSGLDIASSGLLCRLDDLIKTWGECEILAAFVRSPRTSRVDSNVLNMIDNASPRSLHVDRALATRSAVAAALIVIATGMFSVATEWDSGTYAVALAAMASSIFSVLDDPTPIILRLIVGFVAVLPIALLYECAIFPAIDGFPMLSFVLFPVLIPLLILFGNPKYMPVGLGMLAGFCLTLAIQPTFTGDIVTLLNTYFGALVGFFFALAGISLLRVVPAHSAAKRLVRASSMDVLTLIRAKQDTSGKGFRSRALDRAGLLILKASKIKAVDDNEMNDFNRYVKMTTAVVELKAVRRTATVTTQREIDLFLDALGRHFERPSTRGHSPVLDVLLKRLDTVMAAILQLEDPEQRRLGIDAALSFRSVLNPTEPLFRNMQEMT